MLYLRILHSDITAPWGNETCRYNYVWKINFIVVSFISLPEQVTGNVVVSGSLWACSSILNGHRQVDRSRKPIWCLWHDRRSPGRKGIEKSSVRNSSNVQKPGRAKFGRSISVAALHLALIPWEGWQALQRKRPFKVGKGEDQNSLKNSFRIKNIISRR